MSELFWTGRSDKMRRRLGFGMTTLMMVILFSTQIAFATVERFDFEIPSLELSAALNLFAEKTSYSILYSLSDIGYVVTRSVVGKYTPEQALDIMLNGTGLEYRKASDRTISVKKRRKKGEYPTSVNENHTVVLPNNSSSDVRVQAAAQSKDKSRDDIMLEDITVTAQKREQNMQDIGAAITAIKSERLLDSNVTNVVDLQGFVPGLQLGESFGFAQIMIRGIGTDTPFAGGDPSVAMHVDGVVIGQTSAQLGTLFDVDRVEVLRGPQGTLYGRNATGGSVNIITNKPTKEKSGYFRFTVGNYTLQQFDGAAGGPLSDNLLGRIATKIVKRDGYGENLFNGENIDDAETFSIRGHLQWLISEDVALLLTASYHMEDDRNYMPKFRSASYPNSTNPLLLPQPQGFPRASDPYDIYADALLQNERDQLSFTAEWNWTINDRFGLKSITNYQDFEKIPQDDFDATSSPYYTHSEQFTTSQFSEELQLNYEGDRLFGLFGFYYYEEEIESDNRLLQNIPVPPCGGPSSDVLNYDIDALCFHFHGTVDIESYAAFAHFNYDITDDLALILGARYTHEERSGLTDRWFIPGMPPPGLPHLVPFSDEGSYSDVSPKLGLEWLATDNTLLYATYAEGFKSGIMPSGQRNPLINPENIKSYEAGMKWRALNNRFQLNTAAFYYDFTDLQVGRSVPAGATGFTLVYENANSAEVTGLEMEAAWLVTSQFRLDGSLTYLDAEYTDYMTTDPFDLIQSLPAINPGSTPVEPSQYGGNQFSQAPEWAYTLRGEYSFNAFDDWRGMVGCEIVYQDDVFFTPFNRPELGQEAFIKINGNIKFTTPDEKWTLNLWGKNLNDKTAYIGSFIINGSRSNLGMLAPPLTFGLMVGYSY